MKKNYIAPALITKQIHTERLIALSLLSGTATSDDALVKDSGEWDDIWGEDIEE